MAIKTFNNNNAGQNVYLYYCQQSKEAALIDAGCSKEDIKAVSAFIYENNITVKGILITHGHGDHLVAADELKNLTSAAVYCHEAEKEMLMTPSLNLSTSVGMSISVTPEHLLNDTDIFKFGGITLKILHTPGHTPGGVCYYDEENGVLFAGDTLFKNSIGRTDLPAGCHDTLIKNIKEKLVALPDDTKVYPGHGPSTTIGHEKQHNPFV
ncbi:MAG: MBL fold metallo-hydrolase [Candidatus Bathyarchaeota archaeon]|nr:MBL fold metallo-hydrolase [Candidatus Termitimicrobium sp.]